MNKGMKAIVIVLILVILLACGMYFIINKINENKRSYELEQVTSYEYFVVKSGEKYGVIDAKGNVVLNPEYENVQIPNPSKAVFICAQNEKAKAFDDKGNQLFTEYNTIEPIKLKNVANDAPFEKSVLKCEKNNQYGLIDFSGNKITDTIYENIESLARVEGQLLATIDSKVGVINIKGTQMVKANYDDIQTDNLGTGYIVAVKNEDGYKYGYVNEKGKEVLATEYNDIYRVENIENSLYIIASKNGQYGVSKNKKEILEYSYQSIDYDNGLNIFVLEKSKLYGLANIKGDVIEKPINDRIELKGQYIYIEDGDVKRVITPNGEEAGIEFNKTIINTANDNYKITINSKENGNYYGVTDQNGKTLIDEEYLYIEYAFDKYFIACGDNGKLGIVDDKGNKVIDLKYGLVQKIDGKDIIQTLDSATNTTEIYDSQMKLITTMENATINNQLEYIQLSSKAGIQYISKDGKLIEGAEIFPDNNVFAKAKDEKWGFVDRQGNEVAEFVYQKVTEVNEYGYAAIKKDGKWGVMDSNGKVIVEPVYEVAESYGDLSFIGEYFKVQNGFESAYYSNKK